MVVPWKPPCLRRLVIINLRDPDPTTGPEALRGILWAQHGRWLILKNAEGLTTNQPPKVLDGEIVIARDRVDFIQDLP